MKLVIYFGLMMVSLIGSMFSGFIQMKRTNKIWLSFFSAFLFNSERFFIELKGEVN
jgi:hypothetical protein